MKLGRGWKVAIICLAGLVTYFNILFNGFVWDDEEQIVNNQVIRSLGNAGAIFKTGTFNSGGAQSMGGFYRPVQTLYYMLLYQIFGLNAWGYHLAQIGIHILNALLVFKLFERLSEKRAFAGALVFAVHPGISEAVQYVASIGDTLYVFFGLVSINLAMDPKVPNKKLTIIGSSLFLSLLSKEAAVAVLPIMAVGTWLFNWVNRWRILTASILTLASYLFIRLRVVGMGIPQMDLAPIALASFEDRLLTLPSMLTSYLRLFVLPIKLAISQHWVVASPTDIRFWGSGFVLAAVGAGYMALVIKRGSKELGFWSLWLAMSLGIILNVIPLDATIDEGWFYFPFIGLTGLFLYSLPKLNKFCTYVAIAGLVLLSGRTVLRNKDWKNGLVLYGHDIAISQNSYEIENNYGVELYRAGRPQEAKGHFERSIFLQPKWWFAYNNLGAYYQSVNDLVKARENYEASIARADYYLAYENLAFLKLRTDKDENTIYFLDQALGKFPQNDNLRVVAAVVFYRSGRREEALNQAKLAYSLNRSERNTYVLNRIMEKKEIRVE